jgi:membrane associated rhomboid family serine protease
MGIYDREYARRDTPGGHGRGGALGGMRGWSANTWIIAACVVIWVVDGFLPVQLVSGSRSFFIQAGLRVSMEQLAPDYSAATNNLGQVAATLNPEVWPNLRRGMVYVPLRLGPGGPIVGWHEHYPLHTIEAHLHFSTARGFQRVEFWRLIGFQFLHLQAGPWHLLFNMIGLFFFGPIIERHLGSKRYVAFYLLCGIFGALLYTLLNLGGNVAAIYLGEDVTIPGLLFNDPTMPLIGASAGVFGILMAAAYLVPRATVLLFFLIPVQMRYVAYGLVVVSLISLLGGRANMGGEAGHLGGALAGFYFIRRPHHLHGFFDFLGRVDPTSHHYRDKRKARGLLRRSDSLAADQRDVDRILEKISREGLQSLTEREKQVLREASRGR